MATPISRTQITQIGRAQADAIRRQDVGLSFNADFAGANNAYVLNLSSVDQEGIFGVPRGFYIDNGKNPSEVEVSSQGTNLYLTVPPFALGYFKLDAITNGAELQFFSVGGATDVATITVYNYDIPPMVWYQYGSNNTNTPVKVQGAMEELTVISTDPFNNPVFMAGRDPGGLVRGVNVDSSGNLIFGGTLSISNVKIQSAANVDWLFQNTNAAFTGAATANAAVVNSVNRLQGSASSLAIAAAISASADVSGAQVAASGMMAQLDDTSPGTVTENNFGPLRMAADRSLLTSPRATPGTLTIINALTSNQSFFGADATRKGASIYNDSDAILFLRVNSGAASTTNWTVKLLPDDYYEIPYGYIGSVAGIWSAATGRALVTTFAA